MTRRSDQALAKIRARYAARIVAEARRHGPVDADVEAAFANVAREDYLMPPPWRVGMSAEHPIVTSDPADLYHDALVALDPARSINNGQPSLHAGWLGAVAPGPGEHVVQIGVGAGYYTAILARLVGCNGSIDAYEIAPDLAARASAALAHLTQVRVHARSGFGTPLPACDVLYVSAGVAAPHPGWLEALRPGGRLIFPWQPDATHEFAMLVRRRPDGLSATCIMQVSFVACVGGGPADVGPGVPAPSAIAETRSVWLTRERPPDETATAIYREVWFSARAPGWR